MTNKGLSGLSQEEIARQFMLPERKSKIATLLKQEDKAREAYCICRTSDTSRFMIGCDNCEEWYHGDCINISEKDAKYIKQYFCLKCQEEDMSLKIRYKPPKKEKDPSAPTPTKYTDDRKQRKKKERASELYEPRSSKAPKGCGECVNCYQKEDCGRCENCKDMKKFGGANKLKQKCKQRQCLSLRTQGSGAISRRRKRGGDSDSDGETLAMNVRLLSKTPRQCYGPACIQAAKQGSKYCSDECGMKLATNRIYQVLPQRIQEWNLSPCVAEERNQKALESVRKQQTEVRNVLQELDKRHKELDLVVARASVATVDPNADGEGEEEQEISMYCITCGHEIHARTGVRHMEKCFNKYESQASFGSIYKTRIEGSNMFCDFYNPANRTYCKRLRVLCPEHCKDPKVSDAEVCGCPLVTNVFDLTGEFCRVAKKKCVRHYCWEKLRRAEVDMERVRQWLKIDELLEQERQIRYGMANRAGVLALMLHSTYNHELIEKMSKQPSAIQNSEQEQHKKK